MPSAPRHVYVHVPFCGRRCSYCDFAIAVRRVTPVGEYLRGIEMELALHGHRSWEVDTLYLGGGTPSRLGAEGIHRLVEKLRRRIEVAPDAEVTLEANPDDVTPETATEWVRAGVNRVSLGAQSFDPHLLNWMHRTHSAEQIGRAADALRSAGIQQLSLDLIFAAPAELGRNWEVDLDRAIALQPGHLSIYGLTVEPATPLARWIRRGEAQEAPEEQYEVEFLATHAKLTAAAYEHYEVSSYALPGERSRHNSCYWSGASYAGLGPSAHAFDGLVRRWNVAAYPRWLRCLEDGKAPVAGEEPLTAENLMAENVYLGLRTDRGLRVTDGDRERVLEWAGSGWASVDGDTVRLTPLGWLRLDALATDLTLSASC